MNHISVVLTTIFTSFLPFRCVDVLLRDVQHFQVNRLLLERAPNCDAWIYDGVQTIDTWCKLLGVSLVKQLQLINGCHFVVIFNLRQALSFSALMAYPWHHMGTYIATNNFVLGRALSIRTAINDDCGGSGDATHYKRLVLLCKVHTTFLCDQILALRRGRILQ